MSKTEPVELSDVAGLLFYYTDIATSINLMLVNHKSAYEITTTIYTNNHWRISEHLIERINNVIYNHYCKFCKTISDLKCAKHWCTGCVEYRPIYNPENTKLNYICQKCTKCESCDNGAKCLKYVYTNEYGILTAVQAMAICDDCIESCICGSNEKYLYIYDEYKLVRCANCMRNVSKEGAIIIKNYQIV